MTHRITRTARSTPLVARAAAMAVALALTPAAQSFVVTTVDGPTTTYSENFNGGTDFMGDAWTPNSPTHFSDNFIELGPFGGPWSAFPFSSPVPIASLSLRFYYVGALDTPNGTVRLFHVDGGGAWTTYWETALGDTPGTSSVFNGVNPGPRLNGNDTPDDAFFELTLTGLPAGDHVLMFEYVVPQAGQFVPPQLRVDDVVLSVTAVPEPTSALMLGAGLAGLSALGAWRRRRA